jgi:hypothetical protein
MPSNVDEWLQRLHISEPLEGFGPLEAQHPDGFFDHEHNGSDSGGHSSLSESLEVAVRQNKHLSSAGRGHCH